MSSLAHPPAHRRSLRALVALAGAALASTALASGASAAAEVSLTHDPDLNANPIVAVEGTGFTSPTPPPVGLYASQIAIREDGSVVANNAKAKYIRATGPTPDTVLNPDGSFATEVEVEETFGSGDGAGNCAVDTCAVATWLAHTNPTLESLYTSNPIYFSPTITPEPAHGIAASGQTIAVNGGGVHADFIAGNGVNMSQIAIVEGEVKTGPARWIRASGTGANQLTTSGTFTSDLTLSSTFTNGDDTINCGLVQCAVAFWPGHTNPTPESLLAQQDISFGYSPLASVTPTTDLSETQQVTISGSGYNPASPGVYVSQIAQVGDSIITPPPGGGDVMQWVRPAGPAPNQTLNPDGSFETSVTVSRTFQDAGGAIVDCTVVQCSVITWRGHTNPSSATLYTSAPLSFSAPVITTPPGATPPPPSTAPSAPPSAKVKQQNKFKLGTKARKLNIVTVRCGSTVCQFQKPKRVAVKIGNRKLWLAVTGPKRAGAGKVAKFGVRINGRVAKQLAGGKARVKFKVKARSDSGKRTINVNKLLVGASR